MSKRSDNDRPPRHPLEPHLSRVRADLTQLADDIRWVHSDAYWPTRTDPLEPTRPTTRTQAVLLDRADPDTIDAPKYALGVGGDDTSRDVLAEATAQLQRLEFHLAAAVFNAGRRRRQPGLQRPEGASPRTTIDATLVGCSWRLDALHADADGLGRPQLAAVRHHLRAARNASDRAIRVCARALSRGETTGVAHRERPCRICGVRPQAEREHQVRMPNGSRATVTRPSKGGRCDTCATWFTRNGSERPRDLDSDAVDDALAAAGRRASRGEGWGSS